MAGQFGEYPPEEGVISLNGETGDITLVAGPGITITPSGQDITITNTEAAAPVLIGTFDGEPPSPNGLSIVVNVLYAQSASITVPGMVNNTTQSFSGNKTFTGTIAASNFSGSSSGTNTGDVTLGTANGLSLVGQVLSLALSSTSTTGALGSTDWNTFNNKQASGNYITALTGDGTATGPGSVAFTLATVNSNVGSFGSSTAIPTITVNGKGLVTAVSTNVVVAPAGTLSGTTLNSTVVTSSLTSLGIQAQALDMGSHLINNVTDPVSAQDAATKNYVDTLPQTAITALTGDVTATGPGSAAATLATVNSNVGSFTYSSITVNGKGLITAASSGAAPVTTLSAVGASPNANAATISGNTLNLQPFSSTQPGVVTASGGGTTNFLRADGTWATPGGGGGSTLNYSQAYTTSAATWTTNGSTYTDPTVSGTPALTVRTSSGITLTQAGSNFPGITFTPSSSSSVFMITALVTSNYSAGATTFQLFDGTVVITQGGSNSDTGVGGFFAVAMTGVYAPGTTSPVTVRVQSATNSGSSMITGTGGGLTNPIEWTVLQIM